jgi:ribosome-binding protein aMBF1 (putative translation factor)
MVNLTHPQIIVKYLLSCKNISISSTGFMKVKLRHVLATNIRNHRQLLGFSQVKLAEIANISPAYIAMIELERKFPSDEVLERIAKVLILSLQSCFQKSVTLLKK